MSGMKIRTLENKYHLATFSALGANPTPMSFSEVYTALSTKQIDGQDNPITITCTNKFYEVQKFYTLTEHMFCGNCVVVNAAWFHSLPEDYQTALREAVKDMIAEQRRLVDESESADIQEMTDNGCTVTPLTDEQKATVVAMPAAYREMLTAANDELLAQLEANKKKTGYTINQVDTNVSNEDLFTSIISKFKGKVLLVDFWATWCGPCRMANKTMAPMKEELKDKDILYLYITGETSPLKTWENMIPDIHGEHFRLTDAQWKYLSDAFKIEGVPTYLIVDREGNTTFRQTGFPGVEKMKEELLKVTK